MPLQTVGAGGRTRTSDLMVMSHPSYHCSTPDTKTVFFHWTELLVKVRSQLARNLLHQFDTNCIVFIGLVVPRPLMTPFQRFRSISLIAGSL